MPVALGIAATDRSISAQRMTKVSPTAMMPATEMPVSTFQRLSKVRNEGLARLKKITRQASVRNGAMLRSWPFSQLPKPPLCRTSIAGAVTFPSFFSSSLFAATPLRASCSRGFEKPVLAHRLAGEFPHDLTLFHHQDTIGKRQHGFGLGRDDHDADALVAQAAHDLQNVVLGA